MTEIMLRIEDGGDTRTETILFLEEMIDALMANTSVEAIKDFDLSGRLYQVKFRKKA